MQPELVVVPELLEGARTFLRPYTVADAPAQWAAIEESRSHLRPWIRHAPSLKCLDEVAIALAHDRAQWVLRERLIFGIFERAKGGYLGECAFHHIDWKVPAFDLGYWLRRSAEGHGYMREAVDLVSRMAFDQLGARRIEARVNSRNLRSRHILEALGWQCEGRLHQCARDPQGQLIDVDVFALVSAASASVQTLTARLGGNSIRFDGFGREVEKIWMTELREITALFRDRGQAKLAVAAARRQGLEVPAPDALVEDSAGVHVILGTTGAPEDARQLLLEYGAYSASMS